MSVEAVLLDLDGVAIENNKIVPGAVEAIHTVQERGIPVMPVTSRDFIRSLWLTEPLGFKERGVFSGGATIADFSNRKVVWERRIDQHVALDVARLLLPYSVRMNVGRGNKLLSERNPLEDITGDSLGIWAEVHSVDLPEAELILASMNKQYALQHHYNHGTVQKGIIGIHITKEKADKFWTTRHLLEQENIDPEKTVAIADGDIDIPLFNAVGIGVAMGNASAALKARTSFVTGHVLERGLEQAIRKYILEETPSN